MTDQRLGTLVRQLQFATPTVRGLVQSTGAMLRGFGFTSSRTGVGVYDIVYDRPFEATPIPVVTSFNSPDHVYLTAESATGLTVNVKTNAGALVDAAWVLAVYADA